MLQLFRKFPCLLLLWFLTRLHFPAGRHSSLQKETTSVEESLSQKTDSALSHLFLPSYQLPQFNSLGSDEEK